MTSVTFDGVQIVTTAYIPRFTKHESAPERALNTVELARQDGQVLVSENYTGKVVRLEGVINAASLAALDSAIDDMKELFSRVEKNLDIAWNGGTRRYVATCRAHLFERDYFNTTHCPWSAEFVVLSGEGKDTADTTLGPTDKTTTTPATGTLTFLGSKAPRPIIKLEGQNFPSTAKGIQFKNTDTGERIIITKNAGWNAAGDYVKIDTEILKVLEKIASSVETETNFYGVFPQFKVGVNNYEITVGSLMNQGIDNLDSDYSNGFNITADANYYAQSFEVPRTDATFQGYALVLDKTGSPTRNLKVQIETDNGNKPSGVSVSGSAAVIAPASIGSRAWWTQNLGSAFTLQANTKYWLVVKTDTALGGSVDGSNFYTWWFGSSLYAKGNGSKSFDSGANWTDEPTYDFGFKILFGGSSGASTTRVTTTYKKRYL